MRYFDTRSNIRANFYESFFFVISESGGIFYPIDEEFLKDETIFNLTPIDLTKFILKKFLNDEMDVNSVAEEYHKIFGEELFSIDEIEAVDFINLTNGINANFADYAINLISIILKHLTKDKKNLILLNCDNYVSSLNNQAIQEQFNKILYIDFKINSQNYFKNVFQLSIKNIYDSFANDFYQNHRFFKLTNSLIINQFNVVNVLAYVLIFCHIKRKLQNENFILTIDSNNYEMINAVCVVKSLGLSCNFVIDLNNPLINNLYHKNIDIQSINLLNIERLIYFLFNMSFEFVEYLEMKKRAGTIKYEISDSIMKRLDLLFFDKINSLDDRTIQGFQNILQNTKYYNQESAKALAYNKMNYFTFSSFKLYSFLTEKNTNAINLEEKDLNYRYINDIQSYESMASLIYEKLC